MACPSPPLHPLQSAGVAAPLSLDPLSPFNLPDLTFLDLETNDGSFSLFPLFELNHMTFSFPKTAAQEDLVSAYTAPAPTLFHVPPLQEHIVCDSPLQVYGQSSPTRHSCLVPDPAFHRQENGSMLRSSRDWQVETSHRSASVSEMRPCGAMSIPHSGLNVAEERAHLKKSSQDLWSSASDFECLDEVWLGGYPVSMSGTSNIIYSSPSRRSCVKSFSDSALTDFSIHLPTPQISAVLDSQNATQSAPVSPSAVSMNSLEGFLRTLCVTEDIISVNSKSKAELEVQNDEHAKRKGRCSAHTESTKRKRWSGNDSGHRKAARLSEDLKEQRGAADDEEYDTLVLLVKTDNLSLQDGYGWRKYGQKKIKGQTFPRNYLKCDHRKQTGCLAQKRTQRSTEYENVVEFVYLRKHNHPPPWDLAVCGERSYENTNNHTQRE